MGRRTNGDITKDILKLTSTPIDKSDMMEIQRLLMSFPLSSNKLVYKNDIEGMSEDNRDIVLALAVETDERKWQGMYDTAIDMGGTKAQALDMAGDSFGRFTR